MLGHSTARWVKDPALSHLQLRSRLQLGSDPWPGDSIYHGAGKNEEKKEKEKERERDKPYDHFNKCIKGI